MGDKRIKKRVEFYFMVFLMTLLLCATVHAGVPGIVNYQGYLTDSSDTPIGNGGEETLNILFSIYNTAFGGTALWSATKSVTVTDGVFNSELNLTTASPALNFDEDYYLGIKVGSDTEMTPRQIFASVAYAFRAEHANNVAPGVIKTDSLADNAVTASKIADSSIGAAALASNSVYASEIASDAVGALEIASNAVGTLEISDNAVTSAKIAVPVSLSGTVDGGILSAVNDYSGNYGKAVSGAASNTGNVTNYGGYFTAYGTSGRGVYAFVNGATARGMYGYASNTGSLVTNYGGYFLAAGGAGKGVYGTASGAGGRGVQGVATNTGNVTNYGGYFSSAGLTGKAVNGVATNTGTGTNYGGYFTAASSGGRAVRGIASSTGDATTFGGYFESNSKYGRGVYGEAPGANGWGVAGSASGIEGKAVYGTAINMDGENYGGFFAAYGLTGKGVYGYAYGAGGEGVYGEAFGTYGYGVYGKSDYYAGYFSGDVHVSGTLSAATKSFIHPHPDDPSKEIVYVSLEGGENGVYVRGSGQLENGSMEVLLPDHFSLVAAEEGLTVQITPLDDCRGLFVSAKSPGQIVVKEMQGGGSNARFDYLVNGLRLGYEDHQVIRENNHMKPDDRISQQEYEERMSLTKNRSMQKLLIQNGTLTSDGKIQQMTAKRFDWTLGPVTKAERMKQSGQEGDELKNNREQE